MRNQNDWRVVAWENDKKTEGYYSSRKAATTYAKSIYRKGMIVTVYRKLGDWCTAMTIAAGKTTHYDVTPKAV